MDEVWNILAWAIPSGFLSSVATWLITRRKQNNDFLSELQSSINLLSSENKKILAENIQLRRENVDLKANQEELLQRIDRLTGEVARLRKAIGKHTTRNDDTHASDVRGSAAGGVLGEQEDTQQQNTGAGRHGIARLRGRRGRRPADEHPDTESLENARADDTLGAGGADTGPDSFGESDGGEPP